MYRRADDSSTRSQSLFLRATATTLLLVTLAAIMGAVEEEWAGWVGALSFFGAIVIAALAVTQNLERTWYDGRALSESAKSLTWLYVTRGGELADGKADDTFRDRLRRIRAELEDLDFVVSREGSEVTDRMGEIRARPLDVRRSLYLAERLEDQVDYYQRRSDEHRRYATRFRIGMWLAQSAGLAGGLLKALSILDFDFLGIGAAAAASLTAWLQTRDHVTLARAYQLTAADLESVREDVPPANDEAEWGAYVADAESAMSREHVMWLARRDRRKMPA